MNCVEDQDECEHNPCQNGAVCVNRNKSESETGFLCACKGGYAGKQKPAAVENFMVDYILNKSQHFREITSSAK